MIVLPYMHYASMHCIAVMPVRDLLPCTPVSSSCGVRLLPGTAYICSKW